MAEAIYKWRPGSRFKGDVAVVGAELENIRQERGGVTPETVYTSAREKSSPIHQYFTWSKEAAAKKCWEQEARQLIGSVLVTFVDSGQITEPVRAFVCIGEKEDRYIGVVQALSQHDLREKLLKQAFQELAGFSRKYKHLRELADLIKVIDDQIPKAS